VKVIGSPDAIQPPITLPNCGHWTQQERAPEVSSAMIDFLHTL